MDAPTKKTGDVGVEALVKIHFHTHLPIQRDDGDCEIDGNNCLLTTQGMIALHFGHSVIRSL